MSDELEMCKTKIAVLEEKVMSGKETLALQAKEYERRLSGLNHEAEQLKTMQSLYLPRETYVTDYKNVKSDILELQVARAELKGKADQSSLNLTTIISIVGAIFGIVSLILKFFK